MKKSVRNYFFDVGDDSEKTSKQFGPKSGQSQNCLNFDCEQKVSNSFRQWWGPRLDLMFLIIFLLKTQNSKIEKKKKILANMCYITIKKLSTTMYNK